MPASQVVNTGLVGFAYIGDGDTIIQVNISCEAPAGNLGAGNLKRI
ncbi:hypothetical protein [Petrimonas sulfuriphila]